MQTTVSRLSTQFLKEIKVDSPTIEVLDTIIEALEITIDPDPSELYLLESLYHLKENLKLVECKLNSYIIKSRKDLDGNKLNDLYEQTESKGSSKFFND